MTHHNTKGSVQAYSLSVNRTQMVWHKTNCLPESCKNRFTRDFEHLFFFTKKSTGYCFEQQLEPCSARTLKENRAPGVDRQRSYNSKYNRCDFRPGSANHKPDSVVKARNCAVSGNQSNRSDQRNKRCVWSIPTANSKEAHFATFPEELVETPIKAGCPEGGLVLDPFVGTGTTCKVAQDNARQYVGIELNPDFIEIAAKRLKQPNIVWTSKSDERDQFNKVILGDCLEELKSIPDDSVDLIVTDPPYGLKFMNKDWDRAVPKPEIWKQCHRVLKPGAFAFVMCAPRQDCLARMIINLQDAGFDTGFTSLYWTYASGFPKAHNIGKAIDKKFGAERKVIGKSHHNKSTDRFYGKADSFLRGKGDGNFWNVTAPATEQARKFEGAYAGFQPKPAVEVIIAAMKPLDMRSFTDQALSNGKGVTWMDNCRIPYKNEKEQWKQDGGVQWSPERKWNNHVTRSSHNEGRFPANLLVSDDILDDGKEHTSGKMTPAKHKRTKTGYDGYQGNAYGRWNQKDLPLNETYGDTGGYSRFFSLDAWAERNLPFLIVPKASPSEKNFGCDSLPTKNKHQPMSNAKWQRERGRNPEKSSFMKNNHPTVKPVKLMSHLITMASSENDVVLDPFCGSGITCVAAKLLNRRYIGIELEPKYHDIAIRRLEATTPMETEKVPRSVAVQDKDTGKNTGSKTPKKEKNNAVKSAVEKAMKMAA